MGTALRNFATRNPTAVEDSDFKVRRFSPLTHFASMSGPHFESQCEDTATKWEAKWETNRDIVEDKVGDTVADKAEDTAGDKVGDKVTKWETQWETK